MRTMLIHTAHAIETALQFLAFMARALGLLLRVATFPLRHPLATIAIAFLTAVVVMTLSGGPPLAH